MGLFTRLVGQRLISAAQKGHFKAVEALLAKGADVNVKDKELGQTALMWAAQEGYTKIVEALLAKGADLNAKNKNGFSTNGQTALMMAAGMGHTKTVEALLAKCVDVNIKDDKLGKTALMWAAQEG
jgi:ankyrin repeat protein